MMRGNTCYVRVQLSDCKTARIRVSDNSLDIVSGCLESITRLCLSLTYVGQYIGGSSEDNYSTPPRPARHTRPMLSVIVCHGAAASFISHRWPDGRRIDIWWPFQTFVA